MRAWATTFALPFVAPALAAQIAVQPALGGAGQFARLRIEVPGESDLVSGMTAGVQGGLTLGKLVQLEAQYVQGSLHRDGGVAAGDRDLIEGQALLGLAPTPWLALAVGPRVRSLVTAAGTERWVRWEVRARGQAGWRVAICWLMTAETPSPRMVMP